jgi:hypothetical protein
VEGEGDTGAFDEWPFAGLSQFIETFSGTLIPFELLEPLPAPPDGAKMLKRFLAKEKRDRKRGDRKNGQ